MGPLNCEKKHNQALKIKNLCGAQPQKTYKQLGTRQPQRLLMKTERFKDVMACIVLWICKRSEKNGFIAPFPTVQQFQDQFQGQFQGQCPVRNGFFLFHQTKNQPPGSLALAPGCSWWKRGKCVAENTVRQFSPAL